MHAADVSDERVEEVRRRRRRRKRTAGVLVIALRAEHKARAQWHLWVADRLGQVGRYLQSGWLRDVGCR